MSRVFFFKVDGFHVGTMCPGPGGNHSRSNLGDFVGIELRFCIEWPPQKKQLLSSSVKRFKIKCSSFKFKLHQNPAF